MTSIQLLGGKQKLLTIQVANLVHIQSIINWARLLKKSAGFTVALLTSLCVLVYLFTHFHDRINGSPSNTGEKRILHFSEESLRGSPLLR